MREHVGQAASDGRRRTGESTHDSALQLRNPDVTAVCGAAARMVEVASQDLLPSPTRSRARRGCWRSSMPEEHIESMSVIAYGETGRVAPSIAKSCIRYSRDPLGPCHVGGAGLAAGVEEPEAAGGDAGAVVSTRAWSDCCRWQVVASDGERDSGEVLRHSLE